jgi:pimeloyl-ACP methyl ester carboxylesterase
MQFLLPAILLVGLALLVYASWSGPAPLGPAEAQSGQPINLLEPVELGRQKQWTSIRGNDINNPLLLYLHPGPGTADLALLRNQCPDLERHFVVVNWDQRGAGKTFPITFGAGALSMAQLVEDTHQLILYLKQRFGVNKIYLMGFSWGTALGLTMADKYPEDLYAYISVSQLVQGEEGERQSLVYVQQVAKETQNQQAIAELQGIDFTYRSKDWYAQLMKQRKWLNKFGGTYHTTDNYSQEALMLLSAKEYSLLEFLLWPLGSQTSLRQLWPEVMRLNFSETIREINVPVYFFVGRYDYNTPYPITAAYFKVLKAPAGKKLVWFDNSAHHIFLDQPDQIAQEIIRVKDEQQKADANR